MEAIVLDEFGLKYKRNHPIPKIKKNQVLIKVKAVGICGTDMAIVNNTLETPIPIIPGHEISGIVEELGNDVPRDKKDMIGKLVTVEINTAICGKCYYCQSDIPTQCDARKAIGIDIDGGMAGYIAIHHDLIHLLPQGLDPKEGTLIEPLAAAVQTFEMMPLQEDDTNVVIIGAGKLGLLILQVIKALDKRNQNKNRQLMVLGHHDAKLNLAKQFGADAVVNTSNISEQAMKRKVFSFCKGRGADITIEATGNPRALNQAIYLTRKRGKIGLKSTHGVPVPFDLTVAVVNELTLYTSRCGPFEKAIDLVRDELVDLKPMITEIYPLSNGIEAFNDLKYSKANAIKYILEPKLDIK